MEENKELRNFFKWLFLAKINKEKYGEIKSSEELHQALVDNPEDSKQVHAQLNNYSDEELMTFAEQLKNQQPDEGNESGNEENNEESEIEQAKKGTKLNNLKKLQKYKKGSTTKPVKKCACGCDIVATHEAGGKIIEKCSCGCDVKGSKDKVKMLHNKMKNKK